jgi:hypothetical protein
MQIETTTTHNVRLDVAEQFDVTAPAAYSGNIVPARIQTIQLTLPPTGDVAWRLFGYKLRKDGTLSQNPFEFWQVDDADGRYVWGQIPVAVLMHLPYIEQLMDRYHV